MCASAAAEILFAGVDSLSQLIPDRLGGWFEARTDEHNLDIFQEVPLQFNPMQLSFLLCCSDLETPLVIPQGGLPRKTQYIMFQRFFFSFTERQVLIEMLSVGSVTVRYACVNVWLDILLLGMMNMCTCMCKRAHVPLMLFLTVFPFFSFRNYVARRTRGTNSQRSAFTMGTGGMRRRKYVFKFMRGRSGGTRCRVARPGAGAAVINFHVNSICNHEMIRLSPGEQCFLHWFLAFGLLIAFM